MRAGVLVALVVMIGAFVGAAWWWNAAPDDATIPSSAARRSMADAPPAQASAAGSPRSAAKAESTDSPPALGEAASPGATTRELDTTPDPEPDAPNTRTLLVHVVDAETNAELGDVLVIRAESLNQFTTDGHAQTPVPEYAVEHAASPVSIVQKVDPENPKRTRYSFVFCAPGYLRRNENVDYLDPSERTVALMPAATLIVELRGELPEMPPAPVVKGKATHSFGSSMPSGVRDREPMIRLRQKRDGYIGLGRTAEEFGIAFGERPAQLGETTFDETVPGDYTISVEIGASHRSPIVLASKPARVGARQTTHVAIDVSHLAAPKLARLAGTLRIPAGASLDRITIEISPREIPGAIESDWRTFDAKSMEPVAGRDDTWRWDAGELIPGTYSIQIRGVEGARIVELPPTGAADVALEVPAQAQLRVRVVNSSDGSPVKLSWLDWTPAKRGGDAASVSPILLLHDDATHTFHSNVPLGRGELESFGADLWAFDEAVRAQILPGEQELVARVHAIGGALLDMRADGKPLEIEKRLVDAIALAPVGGSGRCVWKRTRDRSPAFAVDPPGRWLVTLPAIEGYEAVAPFEIDVAVGKLAKVTVELRRR